MSSATHGGSVYLDGLFKDFSGDRSKIDLRNANFSGTKLNDAISLNYLSDNMIITHCNFSNSNLTFINFEITCLHLCNFSNSYLLRANFNCAHLLDINFVKTNY